MKEKYDIKISIKAKEDLKAVISYINIFLNEPGIAKTYAKKIKDEISTLNYFPQRNAVIEDDIVKNLEIRKLIIKKHIVFYRINEPEKIVNIERILYCASNWIENL